MYNLTSCIRDPNVHLAIKTTKSSQSWINAVGSVGGGHYDHVTSLLQAIHESKELRDDAPLYFTMGLCVCVGVCVRVRVHVRVHVCMHVHVYIYMHPCLLHNNNTAYLVSLGGYSVQLINEDNSRGVLLSFLKC